MKKKTMRFIAMLLSFLMVVTAMPSVGTTVEAAAKPRLAKKSVSVVVGGTAKIGIKNAPKKAKIAYRSAKKSIATVTQKGVVKGIKSGTTKITVAIKKNSKTVKLTCKVTVKANEYKETKVKVQKVPKKDCFVQVYRAYYDKNGNLVLQCRAANNTGSKITALKNLKITLKSDSGKAIGTYQVKTKKLAVAAGKTKDFQVTIKKANLKDKNANLCKSSCSVSSKF